MRLTPRAIILLGLAGGVVAGGAAFMARTTNVTPFESPSEAADAQRIADLKEIVLQAKTIFDLEGRVPQSLDEVDQKTQRATPTADPATFEIYGYRAVNDSTIEVCATFETDGQAETPLVIGGQQYDFAHASGLTCFQNALASGTL